MPGRDEPTKGKMFLAYAMPYMQKMFPTMERSWVLAHHLWRARWSRAIFARFYLGARMECFLDGHVAWRPYHKMGVSYYVTGGWGVLRWQF